MRTFGPNVKRREMSALSATHRICSQRHSNTQHSRHSREIVRTRSKVHAQFSRSEVSAFPLRRIFAFCTVADLLPTAWKARNKRANNCILSCCFNSKIHSSNILKSFLFWTVLKKVCETSWREFVKRCYCLTCDYKN